MSTVTSPAPVASQPQRSLSVISHGPVVVSAGALNPKTPFLKLALSPATKDGSRLVAEVTFQKPEQTCPKCGSRAVSALGNKQGMRCGQCANQFPAPDQAEDRVSVTGITDDADDLAANQKKAKAPEVAKASDAKDADEDKAADAKQPAQPQPFPSQAANAWKRVTTLEFEPGVVTEIWAVAGARPVSNVKININVPGNFSQPASVAALVSELATVKQGDRN